MAQLETIVKIKVTHHKSIINATKIAHNGLSLPSSTRVLSPRYRAEQQRFEMKHTKQLEEARAGSWGTRLETRKAEEDHCVSYYDSFED